MDEKFRKADMDDRFKQTEDEYFRLRGKLATGRITRAQFEDAVNALRVLDEQGRTWMIGKKSGNWAMYDGTHWIPLNPYGSAMPSKFRKIISHEHFIPWLLFVSFTACYFASTVGIMNSGDGPEYALTQAIVEQHTTQIDDFSSWSRPDVALVNGHTYSKRPPGHSFLAVPFYAIARTLAPFANSLYITQRISLDEESRVEALTMVLPALLSALAIVILYQICLFLTESKVGSLIAGVLFGLGTLMWKYSYSLLRQPLYLFLLVLIFYLLLRFGNSLDRQLSLVIGFLVGYTFVADSTAIVVIPIFTIAFVFIVRMLCQKKSYKLSLVAFFSIGIVFAASILVLYYLASFGEIYRNLYQDNNRTRWMNFGAIFSTPLFPGLFLNLFSNGPLPIEALSPILRNNPVLFAQESADHAIRYSYKGVFFQSPYLIPSFVGFFFFIRKKPNWALLCLFISFAILIPLSMYVDFYSPNAYDTRFFVPMIPFLTIGFAFLIERMEWLNFNSWKLLLLLAILVLSIVSIYNGWLGNLTNYAPHRIAEHRFSMEQLWRPYFATGNMMDNLRLLFINTFPNVYNIHLLFLVYIPLCFVFYLFFFQRKRITLKINTAFPRRGETRLPAAGSSERA